MLPPKESYSNLVSLESLYGICACLPSTRALITFPKADNDKFIWVASFNLWPVACVLLYLSEPAKSTRLSLPALILCSPSSSFSAVST